MPAKAIPIAILDFEANGISQTEAIALTDRLRNELFRLGQFEVVERGLMEDILLEQDFQLTGCTTNDCLVEVGRLIGARQVVGGRISKLGAMFTVSARVVDVETGKVLGVSDYDLRGGLEEMLTVGMKQVAHGLAGLPPPADPEIPETKPPEPLTLLQPGEFVPFSRRHIEIRKTLLGATYKLNGQPVGHGVLWKLILTSNDEEIIRLQKQQKLRFWLSWPCVIIGAVVSDSDVEIGGPILGVGFALAYSSDKKLLAAVKKYNQL